MRKSLASVKIGQSTPQQALQSVVHQLAKELSEQQFCFLLDYFQTKHTKGQLSGAKQLLLQALCAVRSPAKQDTREQQQQPGQTQYLDPSSAISNKTPAAGVGPALAQTWQQQQQQDIKSQVSKAAAGTAGHAQDIRFSRDQHTPPPAAVQHKQVLSAQHLLQQQQVLVTPGSCLTAGTSGSQAAAATAGVDAPVKGSSKWRAFKQALPPLQV